MAVVVLDEIMKQTEAISELKIKVRTQSVKIANLTSKIAALCDVNSRLEKRMKNLEMTLSQLAGALDAMLMEDGEE
jgi:uncharacterized coiled-coil protein SlyX